MNEQRNQADLTLINQLLSCKQGDVNRILQDNQELLDQGLIEIMIAVAQQYEEAERENEARFLMNIAQQLAQALGLLDNTTTESANTPQDYLIFLMETLQKVAENPNPEVIYPFLAQNLDKIDDNLIQILDNWAKKNISSVDKNKAEYIADIINDFSYFIQKFSFGNIAINLEFAITGYKIALGIFSIETSLEKWAITQNNLGCTYLDRIRGDKAENIEQAIVIYTEALKTYTFNLLPQEWASANSNLAFAYLNRIREDKSENIEKAITICTEALKVYTFENFPQDWAATQNNLAFAYSDRIKGNKAENIEQAISHYQQTLKVFTLDTFPQPWAATQNNLANAYSNRIKGDKAENIEQAIAHYHEALKFFTFNGFPQEWVMTNRNLALTYLHRIKGDKAENIKQAISFYQNALQGYEKIRDNLSIAEIALRLGKIKVAQGEWYQGLAYLEKSLKIYRQLDDIKRRADTIYQIAHIHHLIGNHEKASIHYRDALRFYESFKDDRGIAFCKASLGRLMLQMGFVKKAQKLLEDAIIIFKNINEKKEILKVEEILDCITKIKEKQAV